MKYICAILMLAIFALLVFTAVDASRPTAARLRAARIKIGDSKVEAQTIMGRPLSIATNSGIFQLLLPWTERWTYGSLLDWDQPCSREFPWIAPLNFRLFGPESNDIVIYFDAADRVSGIRIPATR